MPLLKPHDLVVLNSGGPTLEVREVYPGLPGRRLALVAWSGPDGTVYKRAYPEVCLTMVKDAPAA